MHDDDFSVYPNLNASAQKIFALVSRLEKSINSKDIANRKNKNESDASFYLRTAITAAEEGSALFRKNAKADSLLTAAWLSIVKNKAHLSILEDEIKPFQEITDEQLRALAACSADIKILPELPKILAKEFGIVLIIEPSFQGMRTDGCVFTVDSGTPVIGLSLRYNRYDHFWFTLMHEMAHICLHYEKLATPILDDFGEQEDADKNKDSVQEEEIEVEANALAKESLIPSNIFRKMYLQRDSLESLSEYSKQAGVHKSIAAGLIRFKEGNYARFSKLVHMIDVANELGIKK